MSQSMQCLQCNIRFLSPPDANGRLACPHCGATRVVAEKSGAATAQSPAPIRPPLTDDDVLAFLDQRPAARPQTQRRD